MHSPQYFHLRIDLFPKLNQSEDPAVDQQDDCLQISSGLFDTELPANNNRHRESRGDRLQDFKTKAGRDWRLERLSVDSIDMSRTSRSTRERASVPQDPGGVATKGIYEPLSGIKKTELGWGIIHLYREADGSPRVYDETNTQDSGYHGSHSSSSSRRPKKKKGGSGNAIHDGDTSRTEQRSVASLEPAADDLEKCTTLCILAVPSYLTPSDFLGFVGEETRDQVRHFRMIRTSRVNRYMVLMKFRDARRAYSWQQEWNGKLFNSMEPECCHVVFVKSVEFQTPDDKSRDASSFPDMTHDPFTPRTSTTTAGHMTSINGGSSLNAPQASLSAKPVAPPTPSLIELPTCPVCLERMDETNGLLTILCQHVFHCSCLQKWKGCGCPVCRYTQGGPTLSSNGGAEPMSFTRPNGDFTTNMDEALVHCSVCASESNLWICLLCGNIGCGRYDEAHAYSHYQETSHSFTMDMATQRVWDYVGDEYVHRLIQNKSDGKLVELDPPSSGSSNLQHTHQRNEIEPGANTDSSVHQHTGDSTGDDTVIPREKMDNMSLEYTYLLTSQLDSQRLYFEEKIAQAADKASQATQTAERASAEASNAQKQLEELRTEHSLLKDVTMPQLERERDKATQRAEKASAVARQVRQDWQEEKTMAASLMTRIEHLQKQVATLEEKNGKLAEEKRDLEDQNHDLTAFISGREKLENLEKEGASLGLNEDEIKQVREGELSVGPGRNAQSSTSKRKGGKGK